MADEIEIGNVSTIVSFTAVPSANIVVNCTPPLTTQDSFVVKADNTEPSTHILTLPE